MFDLGTVKAPSGKILIVDPGYLRLWCGERAPVMPDGMMSAEATARANRAVDLQLLGPNAEAVGRALDLQSNPSFLFDIPRHAVDEMVDRVNNKARELGLRVDVAPTKHRVTHRQRIELALARGNHAGEVMFHGIWTAAFGDIPKTGLRVFGEPMPTGHVEEGRLRRVVIEARGGTIARSERVAYAGVDYARLLVIDVDALADWTTDESRDGKADMVFWGRDEAALAARVNATKVDDDAFGWCDLTIQEAVARGTQIEEVVEAERWRVAKDFRPHSHLHQLMKQVRAGEPGTGVVHVGEAIACGFMTSWGDGIFEVHRDLDDDGRLLRVRIRTGHRRARSADGTTQVPVEHVRPGVAQGGRRRSSCSVHVPRSGRPTP